MIDLITSIGTSLGMWFTIGKIAVLIGVVVWTLIGLYHLAENHGTENAPRWYNIVKWRAIIAILVGLAFTTIRPTPPNINITDTGAGMTELQAEASEIPKHEVLDSISYSSKPKELQLQDSTNSWIQDAAEAEAYLQEALKDDLQ